MQLSRWGVLLPIFKYNKKIVIMATSKSVGVRFPLDIYLKILEYCTSKDITFTDYILHKVVTSDDLINKKASDLGLSSKQDNRKLSDLENTIFNLSSEKKQLLNNIHSLERNLLLQDNILIKHKELLDDIIQLQSMLFIFSDVFPDICKNINKEYLEKNEDLKRNINILYKAVLNTNKIIKEKDIERRISEYNN
jgi:hypothetical protein